MKRIFLLLIPFILWSLTAKADSNELKSGVFNPPRLAPDFTLLSSIGGELALTQTRGKLVVLGFGFTHCTEVCPITLSNLAQVRKALGEAANNVQVLYITVDPEQDSPTRLREYLSVFDSSFIGLTGTPAQLAKVQQEYGIVATKIVGKQGESAVHHSSYIYLIDSAGYLRALVPFGKKSDDIVHDIKILLQTNNPINNKASHS